VCGQTVPLRLRRTPRRGQASLGLRPMNENARQRWPRVRALAKEAFALCVRLSGIPFLVRHTYARRKVGILVYHDPDPELLERHLRYLVRRYTLIPLDDLVRALQGPDDWSTLPRNSLVVTLDDGHASNAQLGAVFASYAVRPTIYLSTHPITGSGRFWFRTPGLDPEPLKLLENGARLAALASSEPGGSGERHALLATDLTAMREWADFGSHTLTHPVLPMCSDEDSRYEVVASKSAVEELVHAPCRHFSYPNGDYTEREVSYVAEVEYDSARTAEIGWNGPSTSRFHLKIVSIGDHASVNMLAAHLGGVLLLKRLLARRRRDPKAARDVIESIPDPASA
jgi:peptidoglycan/xylan/chitin deacetylase (PgdA/CDA1 family)